MADSSKRAPRPGRDPVHILLIEDNPPDAWLIRTMLERERIPFDLVHAVDLAEARQHLSDPRHDVVLLDLNLPDADGIEVVREVHATAPSLPVVVLTGQDDMEAAHEALESGAQDYLVKGRVEADLLLRTISYAIERNRQRLEHEAMTAQLAQVEHLAALGTLAAGVAHEVNNPLLYIQLNLDTIKADLESVLEQSAADEDLYHDIQATLRRLDEVRRGTQRIETVVKDLLTFTRPPRGRPTPMSVQAAVEWAVQVARKHIEADAHLDLDLQRVPLALGDEVRVSQVILNLLLNTSHAWESSDRLRNQVLVRTWQEGDEICIQVRDNGRGMPEKTRAHIFDPFFTTRAAGEGTGLGLYVAQTTISHIGGRIEVQSIPSEGTTFEIWLPAAPEDARRPRSGVTGQGDQHEDPARPRVLVVDDDALVVRTLQEALRTHFDVVAVGEAEQALDLILADEPFDAILCDLVMPGLGGTGFYTEVERVRPEIARRFVFMTGGACTARSTELLDRVENPCLLKPFRPEDVVEAVHALLASAPAG